MRRISHAAARPASNVVRAARKRNAWLGLGAWLAVAPLASHAQTTSTVLIQPAIDPVYNRDRNVSVTERPHPDYDAIGIRLGSFLVDPALGVTPGFSDNVYLDNNNKKSDIYAQITPYVNIASDWSSHRLAITASGDLRRYAHQTLKNQNAWYVYSQGRLDVTSDLAVQFDGQLDRSYESPYVEDVVANLTAPSTYLRKSAAIKATYQPGRSRLIGTLDVNSYRFNALVFANGGTRDQRFRDRVIYRAAGLYEFALSPSLSVYGQTTYDRTDYSALLPGGIANRDSTALNVVAGANFDFAGLARGSLGVGYSRRKYAAAAIYQKAQGVSVQAKVEYFPTELTTVGLSLQRQLQDASLGGRGAYWDNRFSLGVDHELLVNLILSANADFARRTYSEVGGRTDVYQFRLGGRYQASRTLGINAGINYGLSKPQGAGLGNPFNELGVTVGVRIRR
ncbi:outer membrane beta-barrel protein [soil metagenome]